MAQGKNIPEQSGKQNAKTLQVQSADLIRTNFKLVRMILLLTIAVVIGLSSWIFWLIINRPDPASYVYDTKKVSRLVRLELPNISNEAIMRWSSQAVSDIFTFNFLYLDQHLEKVKEYFTEDGYKAFIESSQLLFDDVRAKDLKYQANSCDVVSIKNTQQIRNINTTSTLWLIEIPMLIEIESKSEKKLHRYVFTAMVEGGSNVRSDKTIAFVGLKQFVGTNQFCSLKEAL